VGHADLIKVWKYETKIEAIRVNITLERMEFSANVLTRFVHQR